MYFITRTFILYDISMITNFPILQNSPEPRRKFCTIKRDLLCSNKLDFICNRLKIASKKVLRTEGAEDSLDQSLNQEEIIEKMNKQQYIATISPNKLDSLQESVKKRYDGLNKNFNRTKIDWDHNFVGNKYLQKIREELRCTKYSTSPEIKQEQKTKSSPILHLRQFSIYRQKSSCMIEKQRKGVSEEQLARIRQVRQERRKKAKYIKSTNLENEKKMSVPRIIRKEVELEKSTQISPWEDYPSRLSSIFMKGN